MIMTGTQEMRVEKDPTNKSGYCNAALIAFCVFSSFGFQYRPMRTVFTLIPSAFNARCIFFWSLLKAVFSDFTSKKTAFFSFLSNNRKSGQPFLRTSQPASSHFSLTMYSVVVSFDSSRYFVMYQSPNCLLLFPVMGVSAEWATTKRPNLSASRITVGRLSGHGVSTLFSWQVAPVSCTPSGSKPWPLASIFTIHFTDGVCYAAPLPLLATHGPNPAGRRKTGCPYNHRVSCISGECKIKIIFIFCLQFIVECVIVRIKQSY